MPANLSFMSIDCLSIMLDIVDHFGRRIAAAAYVMNPIISRNGASLALRFSTAKIDGGCS